MSTSEELKNGIEERLDELNKKGECVNVYLWDLLIKYNDNDHDEKQEHNDDSSKNKQSETKISNIVDFKNVTSFGMCDRGHDMSIAMPFKQDQCNECKESDGVYGCLACCNEKIYKAGGGKQYLWCKKCRKSNVNKVHMKWKSDENKRQIIRNILSGNPSLELDLLCGLPKAVGLNNTLSEITALNPLQRCEYALYLVDLDNFKSLNSALGHDGANNVIVDIANIFKKYKKQIDQNEWNKKKYGKIQRLFIYRQGGDEFALIVKSGGGLTGGQQEKQKTFFESVKKEINLLGNQYLNNINTENEEKANQTFKDRKMQTILHEMQGYEISNNIKNEIINSIKTTQFDLSLNKIGISVGMYCIAHTFDDFPQTFSDWIKGAERAQDEAKKLPGKNAIKICKITKVYANKMQILEANSFWKD